MTELTPNAARGKAGETHARIWLEARGYRLIAANWHCRAGELDLVMLDATELVFIEVKTRSGEHAGRASDAVSASKRRKMLAAAEWFVAQHPTYHDTLWRCDIVAVTLGPDKAVQAIEHFINAIYEE